MRILALCVFFMLFISSSLNAGTEIKQKISSYIDNKKTESTHIWTIEGKEFHLAIESENSKTTYFYNSRNFYICAKLDDEQLKFLIKNQLRNPKILAQFKNGACQRVPSNFMVRFFLSPTAAVESINRSDGMRLSLEIHDFDVKKLSKKESLLGSTCNYYSRNYKMIKSGSDGLHLENTLVENFCIDENIKWRDSFWKEVKMTVMRQPHVRKLLASLNKDETVIKGFTLSGNNSVSFTDSKGKRHSGKRLIKTSSVKTLKASPKLFAIPIGYTIFSPETLTLALDDLGGKKDETKKETLGTDSDAVTSMVLCALAGPLGCLLY